MADQARHVEGVEQALGGPVPGLPRFEPAQDLLGRAEDVAVGDACRGVDAVDDDVGLRLGQDVVEDEGAEVRVVEAAELGPDQVALGALLEQPEEVAGRGGEHGRAGLGLELLGGLPRLLEAQAVDLDLARPARQQLAADGHADEAVPSEHKDLPVLNVHTALLTRGNGMPDVARRWQGEILAQRGGLPSVTTPLPSGVACPPKPHPRSLSTSWRGRA